MVRPKNYTFFFFLWLVLCNSYCLSPSGMLHLYRVYLTFWWSASHSGFCCLEQWTILCVSFGQPWATVYLFRLSSFYGFAGALVVYVFSHGPCFCGLGIHPCETCLHVWGFIDFTCHQPPACHCASSARLIKEVFTQHQHPRTRDVSPRSHRFIILLFTAVLSDEYTSTQRRAWQAVHVHISRGYRSRHGFAITRSLLTN